MGPSEYLILEPFLVPELGSWGRRRWSSRAAGAKAGCAAGSTDAARFAKNQSVRHAAEASYAAEASNAAEVSYWMRAPLVSVNAIDLSPLRLKETQSLCECARTVSSPVKSNLSCRKGVRIALIHSMKCYTEQGAVVT